MRRALVLAGNGCGHTSPNPMVGCVIVKNDRIIGEGWHAYCGGLHAERNALKNCTEDPSGADLYVTLEPCCHYGKTPPCTEAIIQNKIRKVYVGCMDPNPKVAGKGVEILRKQGILVETGVLEAECLRANEVFFHYITTKTPFVAMKYAMTLDGKIAAVTGDSRWVTGEVARSYVHALRKRYTGIMAGIGTVMADDPLLNCRTEAGVDPVRIICDSCLRIPLDSQLVKTAKDIPLIVAGVPARWTEVQQEKEQALLAAGVTVLHSPGEQAVDLPWLMQELGAREIDGILLEGGGELNGAALEAGIVQKVYAFVAPKLIGGADAKGPVGGLGLKKMCEARALTDIEIQQLGQDICISGRLGGV